MKIDLYEYLGRKQACNEALEWIDENNLSDPQAAWDMCPMLDGCSGPSLNTWVNQDGQRDRNWF
jgi:hypothetical protein